MNTTLFNISSKIVQANISFLHSIGESAFTPEMLRPAIEAQERKYAALMTEYKEAEADLHDSENNLLALSEKFDDMLQ